ncbi:hypothetical protein [Comamonas testosteroni]|uniref:hypothetical protein n=1 Tax=Comamonas testosteroni TaxID=285 RepID=UPI0028E95B28|nr:hypothetical protein [Comamonas testosteroni]
MRTLTPEETADYLEASTVIKSMDAGFAITHMGINAAGIRFLLMTDCHEKTTVTEGM